MTPSTHFRISITWHDMAHALLTILQSSKGPSTGTARRQLATGVMLGCARQKMQRLPFQHACERKLSWRLTCRAYCFCNESALPLVHMLCILRNRMLIRSTFTHASRAGPRMHKAMDELTNKVANMTCGTPNLPLTPKPEAAEKALAHAQALEDAGKAHEALAYVTDLEHKGNVVPFRKLVACVTICVVCLCPGPPGLVGHVSALAPVLHAPLPATCFQPSHTGGMYCADCTFRSILHGSIGR